MRTAVKGCRCPCSFLYCFLRLKWKTRILSPRPSSTTLPTTRAPLCGRTSAPGSPETARTSVNSILPFSAGFWSTLITSPGATRNCFPPARMTAYIGCSFCREKLLADSYQPLRRGLRVLRRGQLGQTNPFSLTCYGEKIQKDVSGSKFQVSAKPMAAILGEDWLGEI